jgi:N utilization substance protein B
MTIPLQKMREAVFLCLFSFINGEPSEKETLKLLMEQLKIASTHAKAAYARALTIEKEFPKLDALIAPYSTDYEFERIQTVEKTALRIGVFELLEKEVPPKVAIAESLRLTKKFCTPSAVTFVNAILDKLYAASGK